MGECQVVWPLIPTKSLRCSSKVAAWAAMTAVLALSWEIICQALEEEVAVKAHKELPVASQVALVECQDLADLEDKVAVVEPAILASTLECDQNNIRASNNNSTIKSNFK